MFIKIAAGLVYFGSIILIHIPNHELKAIYYMLMATFLLIASIGEN